MLFLVLRCRSMHYVHSRDCCSAIFFRLIAASNPSFPQVVNGCIKDPVLGTKIDIETGDVVDWCPSLLGKLLSPILGPEPENAGVNVFKVSFRTLFFVVCVGESESTDAHRLRLLQQHRIYVTTRYARTNCLVKQSGSKVLIVKSSSGCHR